MKYEILNRFTGEVIFALECESMKECVEPVFKDTWIDRIMSAPERTVLACARKLL